MIGKLLGHTQVQTTARYAHLANDPVNTAAGRVADMIDAAMLREWEEAEANRDAEGAEGGDDQKTEGGRRGGGGRRRVSQGKGRP
jgi:hypothetical protein